MQKCKQKSKVVIGLIKHIEKKGHIVFTDNFYTSPTLADFLLSCDTYLFGTIRTNRKGYHKELVPTNAQARQLQRGDSDWLMFYLSSYHKPQDANLTTTRKKTKMEQRQYCL